MGFRGKSINNEVGIYLFYLFIISVILNALTLVIPDDYIMYVSTGVNFVPIVMLIVFLVNLWGAFSMDKVYIHIVPVSKRKIFFDIFIKWIVFYTLAYLTKIIFIAVKIDLNYLYQNVNLTGLFINLFIVFMVPISVSMFFSSLILLSKILNIRFIVVFIIGVVILSMAPKIKDITYTYENHIDINVLENDRVIKDKISWLMEDDNEDISNIVMSPWMKEEQVSFMGIINTIPLLIILGYCIKNIERASLEYVPRKTWYNKWIK